MSRVTKLGSLISESLYTRDILYHSWPGVLAMESFIHHINNIGYNLYTMYTWNLRQPLVSGISYNIAIMVTMLSARLRRSPRSCVTGSRNFARAEIAHGRSAKIADDGSCALVQAIAGPAAAVIAVAWVETNLRTA